MWVRKLPQNWRSLTWTKPRSIADISDSGFLHKFALKCKQSGLKLLPLRGDSSRNSVISQSCQNMPYSLLLNTLPITMQVVWYLPHLSYCESKFIQKCLQDHPFVATHSQGSLWASHTVAFHTSSFSPFCSAAVQRQQMSWAGLPWAVSGSTAIFLVWKGLKPSLKVGNTHSSFP